MALRLRIVSPDWPRGKCNILSLRRIAGSLLSRIRMVLLTQLVLVLLTSVVFLFVSGGVQAGSAGFGGAIASISDG